MRNSTINYDRCNRPVHGSTKRVARVANYLPTLSFFLIYVVHIGESARNQFTSIKHLMHVASLQREISCLACFYILIQELRQMTETIEQKQDRASDLLRQFENAFSSSDRRVRERLSASYRCQIREWLDKDFGQLSMRKKLFHCARIVNVIDFFCLEANEKQRFDYHNVQHELERIEKRLREFVGEMAILELFSMAILYQEQWAWTNLWILVQPRITAKIRRELSCGKRPQQDIEDLTIRVFEKFAVDTKDWEKVDRLYTEAENEGILSRLYSTTIYELRKYRQRYVRKLIPIVRKNYVHLSAADQTIIIDLVKRLKPEAQPLFERHLQGTSNQDIATEMHIILRDVSITINRSWERFLYILIRYRSEDEFFEPLWRQLNVLETEQL